MSVPWTTKDPQVNAISANGEVLRLMTVHAHPDDESSKGAATIAKYAAEGAEVLVVTCTGGERGDVLNPTFHVPDGLTMSDVRRQEMAASVAALGVRHAWLGFVDSGLPEGGLEGQVPAGSFASFDVRQAAEPLVRLIRSFRPHVVITYNEQGGYPHPDHLMCHKITVEAIVDADDADMFPGTGLVWRVPKLYYDNSFSGKRFKALYEALSARGIVFPFEDWMKEHLGEDPRADLVTTHVECADYFPARDAALRAHASQIDPDSFFFAVPSDLEREVWPTEEFELVHSTAPISFPEDDLFAGLR